VRISYACILGLVLLLNDSYAHAQEPQTMPSSNPTIRVNSVGVDVGVTVTDLDGHFVRGLHRQDFQVFDNGVEQPVTAFASNEGPAQVVFLIEDGTEDFLLGKTGKNLFVGADNLLNNIAPDDRVAIVTYANHPKLALDFAPDKASAHFVLSELNSEMLSSKVGSSLLNLSTSVATTLDWLGSISGSKTVVLLSTGIDTSPPEEWQVVQEKIKTSDVRILAISMLGDFRKPLKGKKQTLDRDDLAFLKQGIAHADQSLHGLSEATGGHIYFPKNADESNRAYGEIAQLIREQYTLGFTPALFDGQIHSIRVKVKHSSRYHVDSRQAYVAPAPPSE